MLVYLLIGVFVAAAIAWPLLYSRRPALARWLPIATGVAGVLLAAGLARAGAAPVILSAWTASEIAGGSLTLYPDPLSLLFAGLIALLVAACSLAARSDGGDAGLLPMDLALWLAAAAVSFCLAGNPITLMLAWVLVDAAVIATHRYVQPGSARPVRIQTLALNYLGAMLVFMAGIIAAGQRADLANQVWTIGSMAGLPAALLILAAWIRLGGYPFQRGVPDVPRSRAGTLLRFIPMLAGAYLLTRTAGVAGDAPVQGIGWALLLGLAALAAAALAWLAPARPEALGWLAVYAASLLLLGMTAGQPEVGAYAVLGSFGLIVAMAILFLAEPLLGASMGGGARLWLQLTLLVALLSLWGLPITAGFLHRWGVYRTGLDSGQGLTVTLTFLASAVAAAPLWLVARDVWATRRAPRLATTAATRETLVGVTLLVGALGVVGIAPVLIAPALEAAAGPVGPVAVADSLRGAVQGQALLLVGLILGAWLAGLGLSLVRAQLPPDSRTVRDLRAALSLGWLYQRRWRPVRGGLSLLQTLTDLGAGERYVGMLVIFAFILALALLAQQ